MKTHSSPSPSPVSPSPFHLNSDDAATGCIASILRRLVCGALDVGSTGSRLAHAVADAAATDAVLGGGTDKSVQVSSPLAAAPVPGIVARLMGLESMPACAPHGPIGRSRSTGSPEGWPAFPPARSGGSLRQIMPSHSFRETPTFLRQENDEFLLLSFAADDGEEYISMMPHPKGTEPDMGTRRELEKKAREETEPPPDIINKEEKKNVQRVRCREKKAAESCRRSHFVSPRKAEAHGSKSYARGRDSTKKMAQKETHDRTGALKRREKKARSGCSKTTAEAECSSQNSSPVSVLDHLPELDVDCLTDNSTPISDAEEEAKPARCSRTKLSSELECFTDPSHFLHLILTQETEGFISIEEGRRVAARSAVPVLRSSSDQWAEARGVAEGEVQMSCWERRQPWSREELEAMVVEFGLQVLDGLLHETVGEICHGQVAVQHSCG